MDAYVQVVQGDGTAEVFPIREEQAKLGRSPNATIPIPDARELELEHLMIVPQREGCWIAPARGAATPVMKDGQVVQPGVVPWGTELIIGALRITLNASRPEPERESVISTPVKVFVLVVMLGTAGLFLWNPSQGQLQRSAGVEPPVLFDEDLSESCEASGDAAERRAAAAAEAAAAKFDRYPFEAQDGIDGVRLYSVAAACYRQVGQDDAARGMERERKALRQRVERDYRQYRFRLDRALEHGDLGAAFQATDALLTLTMHRKGEYHEWLTRLRRQLRVRLSDLK